MIEGEGMKINTNVKQMQKTSLEGIAFLILKMLPGGELNIAGYASTKDLFASDNLKDADIAVLDYNCMNEDGLNAVQALRRANRDLDIFIMSSDDRSVNKGFRIHPGGFLSKSLSEETVRNEFSRLGQLRVKEDALSPSPMSSSSSPVMGIKIRCFGSFEAFLDGTPIHFRYQKTKELLAYLIDRRGAMCTNRELEAYLWSESSDSGKRHYAYLLKIKEELIRIFKDAGYEDVLIRRRGNIAINPDLVDCDYYRCLKGSRDPEDQFRGEYMRQYSWGEYTLGYLLSKSAEN